MFGLCCLKNKKRTSKIHCCLGCKCEREIMEDSATTGHHNERKRSCDNNAFAKFVPFSPPLEHDTESIEAKFGGHHDHGQKRLKPNSQAPLLETTTNFSPSSHLPNQNIDTKETPDFPSPSTSFKHSDNVGPSPQSIGSKSSHIEYVENDGKISKTVSDSEFQHLLFLFIWNINRYHITS